MSLFNHPALPLFLFSGLLVAGSQFGLAGWLIYSYVWGAVYHLFLEDTKLSDGWHPYRMLTLLCSSWGATYMLWPTLGDEITGSWMAWPLLLTWGGFGAVFAVGLLADAFAMSFDAVRDGLLGMGAQGLLERLTMRGVAKLVRDETGDQSVTADDVRAWYQNDFNSPVKGLQRYGDEMKAAHLKGEAKSQARLAWREAMDEDRDFTTLDAGFPTRDELLALK